MISVCTVPRGLTARIPGFHPGGPVQLPAWEADVSILSLNFLCTLLETLQRRLCFVFSPLERVINGKIKTMISRRYFSAENKKKRGWK